MVKEWSRLQMRRHNQHQHALAMARKSMLGALSELRAIDESLYQQALQEPDPYPLDFHPPTETPPIPGYDVKDHVVLA